MSTSHLDAPADVTNHIFTFSPSSALPQALRLARCQVSNLVQRPVGQLPSEKSIMDRGILRGEASILAHNGKVVIALENIFSRKFKDRFSRESQLSQAESLRFRRAMYRRDTSDMIHTPRGRNPNLCIKRFWTRFPQRSCSRLEEFPFSCGGWQAGRSAQKEAWWAGWIHVYYQFYICFRSLTCYRYHLDDFNGSYLFAGPRAILESYEGVTIEPLQLDSYIFESEGVHRKFLLSSLGETLEVRGDSHLLSGLHFDRIIVDRVIGENDKCEYCHLDYLGLGPFFLYNESNWDELKGTILHDWRFFIKEGLLSNREEASIVEILRSMNFLTLFHELLHSRQDTYSHWSKEKWACNQCLFDFFGDNLPFWLLNRKRKAGTHIMRDCRYGYDCRQQKSKSHAQQFNHLCAPLARNQGSQ